MSANAKTGYKDTLNLPKTSFEMKANLVAKEPAIRAMWQADDLYGRIRRARAGAERFILHDGPPYANGNIHMGTALNKVLKDIVVRVRNMLGFDSPYLPGWDCHGLPIEQMVMDEMGATPGAMAPMEIRRRCHDYAEKFARIQSEQFQRLGVMGQFGEPYITMHPQYEAAVLEVFARLVAKGVVHKQLKPVHWSIENRTALADAELEYHDREDQSIYVALPVVPGSGPEVAHLDKEKETLFLVIWTTTPWTLPANEAVAVNPELRYRMIYVEPGPSLRWKFLVASSCVESMKHRLHQDLFPEHEEHELTILPELYYGKDFIPKPGCDENGASNALRYRHPIIDDKMCPVVAADYVKDEEGTGLVHTAPGHGLEDYGTGIQCGLPITCPVKGDGTFDETVPKWLQGLSVWEANDRIVKHLEPEFWNWDKKVTPPGNPPPMLAAKPQAVRHSYPHDWRSKTPTIFRATEQWFIAVDRPLDGGGPSLRELAMQAVAETGGPQAAGGGVRFVPAWGRNRITGMLQTRPDWCISRQRAWGLPIPVFYNREGEPLLTAASVRAVAGAVAREGSDAWFNKTPAELLAGYDAASDPDLAEPSRFRPDDLTPGRDIFDVWFESGSSWFAAAMQRGVVEDIPIDLYLEGSDQHRGWFQLSLLPALGAQGRAPFRTVLTHGFVVTEDGHKMSKSLGNAIDVIEQLSKRGADILRLWVASQNYQDDVRCSEGLIAQAEDAYRKVRNTLRFCMGACCDFDPAKDAAEPAEGSIDEWMRMQLHLLTRDVLADYEQYEFHRAARRLYEFCTVEASSVYLSAVKDRLYCEAASSPRRRATQTVIHQMLLTLVKLYAPILPYTCDEAWGHIPNRPPEEPDNVHLAMLPGFDAGIVRTAEDTGPGRHEQGCGGKVPDSPGWRWGILMYLRTTALAKLEALRNAGVKNPLDAEVVLKVARGSDPDAELIETHLGELEDMLGVGYARLERVDAVPEGLAVDIEVLDGREKYQRCARSWKRRPDVGSDAEYPDLSARDAAVMRTLRGD